MRKKSVLITQKDGEIVFLVADGSAKLSERDYKYQEPTLGREFTVRRERISAENFNLKKQKMTRKLEKTSGLFKEISFIIIILNRVRLYFPQEESFPNPLKCIDVIRSTHTALDVAEEKRIDDYWNVDGSRSLSNSFTGFKIYTVERNSSKRICVVRGETAKNPNDITSRSHMA